MNILKIKSRKLTLLLVATMDKRIVMAVTNVLHWSIYKCVLWLLCLIWYEKWISGGQRLQGCMRTVKVPDCDTISVRGEGYERGTSYGQKNKKGEDGYRGTDYSKPFYNLKYRFFELRDIALLRYLFSRRVFAYYEYPKEFFLFPLFQI